MNDEADYQPFDLLGDPVDPNHNGRGAPSHAPTREKQELVIALWAEGKTNEYCAAALGIAGPTFRKHYFRTKKQKALKDNAGARIHGLMISTCLAEVKKGSMTAVKQLREIMHRADLERLSREIAADRREEERDASPAPAKGKKEQQADAARDVGGLYAPGEPPRSLVN